MPQIATLLRPERYRHVLPIYGLLVITAARLACTAKVGVRLPGGPPFYASEVLIDTCESSKLEYRARYPAGAPFIVGMPNRAGAEL